MLKLEELKKDAQIQGLLPNEVVRLVNIEEIGPKRPPWWPIETPKASSTSRPCFASDEHRLTLATAGKAWAFRCRALPAFKLALGGVSHQLRPPVRPDDGRPHLQRRAAAAPDLRGVRIHAAAPATALRAGRRPRCRQDHHGRPADSRTDHALRRPAHPGRVAGLAVRAVAGRTARKVRSGVHPVQP
jgi:hypothetical protein